MPIYEFYCGPCHTVFSFLSRRVNTSAVPDCPRCKSRLSREVSRFATVARGRAAGGEEAEGGGELPVDEARMERAMDALAGEAESLNEDDPRAAARLMRRFSDMTGMQFGSTMETALQRMEEGEDPERIEEELGPAIENEEPFVAGGGAPRRGARRNRPPARDTTLYDM